MKKLLLLVMALVMVAGLTGCMSPLVHGIDTAIWFSEDIQDSIAATNNK